MKNRRRQILGVIGALIIAGTVHADMVPVTELHGKGRPLQHTSSSAESRQKDFSGRYDCSVAVDLDLGRVRFLPEAGADAEQSSQMPHAIELTGGPGSCSLCLYALMGLGLCCAPHWVKRLAFGFIPEWYHDGGPFQIGHSYAATPESLCTLQACYLAPTDEPVEPLKPQYRLGIILSLWRKSRFIPTILASRGPPS